MKPKHLIAFEIGSSKIRGAAGVVDASGFLTVLAVEEERLIDCVRHGLIRNVEEVSLRIGRIAKKLEHRLNLGKVRGMYVGIGGLSFCAAQREVTRRLPEEAEFTEELRSDLRAEAFGLKVGDRETVDVTERRIFIDRSHMPQPVGVYGQDIRAEFNVVTCLPRATAMVNRAVSERLGMKLQGTVVRQLSQAALVLTPDEKQLGCVLVDCGAETTTISIYKNGYLNYLATLPLGSRNITIDITALNYLEQRAEELKKIGGNAMGDRNISSSAAAFAAADGVNFDEINNYVAARAGEIIANINEQIKYAELSYAMLPKGIVVVGAGSRLGGFNQRLELETKMPVRVGTPIVPGLRFADPNIKPAEVVDVVSILHAASRADAADDCLEPAAVQPKEQEQEADPIAKAEAAKAEAEAKAAEAARLEAEARAAAQNQKAQKPGFFTRMADFGRRIFNDDGYEEDFNDN